ncbi:MAG: 50S ribosomal protein L29 [Candidatus ainarchaeum sp.]|nr:50S ribosomal protein L29 [Candidatus ainarchaeum sp.]
MRLKKKELNNLTAQELQQKVIELKQELAKERATISSGTKSENPGKIKKIRKDIARLFTEINEKGASNARNR